MRLRLVLLGSLAWGACTVPLVGVTDAGRDGGGTADLGASDSGVALDGGQDGMVVDDGVGPIDDGVVDGGPVDLGPADAGCGPGGLATYYADCDRDGYGSDAMMTMGACSVPPSISPSCGGGAIGSWVGVGGDCTDQDASAYPGETMYHSVPRVGGGVVALRYDYDCDGVETPQYAAGGVHCGGTPPAGMTCDSFSSWEGTVAPTCGGSGTLRRCVAASGGSCALSGAMAAVQACR